MVCKCSIFALPVLTYEEYALLRFSKYYIFDSFLFELFVLWVLRYFFYEIVKNDFSVPHPATLRISAGQAQVRGTSRGVAVAPLVVGFAGFSSGWSYFYVRRVGLAGANVSSREGV